MDTKGKFIVFEGIDGSGKTTQIGLLSQKLKSLGISCYETREPTGSEIGILIRRILSGEVKTDLRVLPKLFAADRMDHLLNAEDGLCKKINDGAAVICDRYYFSSYAYHAVDVSMDDVILENAEAARLLKPDCTIFIDVDPEQSLKRIAIGRESTEIFETRERLTAVRAKYFEAFEKLKKSETIAVIDGNGDCNQVFERIWSSISYLFKG